MDEQALTLAVPPGLIGVNSQHRHIAHQLQALAQHILQADVVGLVIIAEQGQNGPLHGIHQILGRIFQNDVPEEVGGQGAVGGQLDAEILQLLHCGQLAEQQQVSRLLKGKAAPLGRALDDFPAVDAPVVQNTVGRGDVLPVSGVHIHVVGLDLRYAGQSGQDAAAILIPQAPLDVVFFIQLGVDIVLLFPLLFQG